MRTRAALFLSVLALFGGSAAAAPPATEPPAAAVDQARSRRPTPDELERRIERGDALLLDAGVFDPLRDPLPAFTAGRTVTGTERTFLVQFRRELTAADRRLLEEDGVRFVDYVPSHAYLLQAPPATFARLRANALVRWADTFRGGYKVAGVLRSAAWREAVYLDLRLLPKESGVALMDRVRALDPSIELVSLRGEMGPGATLRVLVPEGRLHPFAERVAEDPAVWSVQPWYLPEIHNDDGIWVEQSYDTVNQRTYAVTAPMWSHGITGTGQVAGISDTGLDSDMCFFRTSAALSAVTDAQSPALPETGTIDLTKKVVAYYVMPSATPYDGNTICSGRPESWHGTHTSGTIVGDNFFTLSTGSAGGHDTGDGMAPNAKLVFQDIGSETTGCLDGLQSDFHLIAQQAYDAGVRVHSNSWGASVGGAYTSASAEVDEISYAREDLLFVYSAGNSGSVNTVSAPGTAKAALTVAASGHGSSNTIAAFSSRGPTDDGRRKPDITAPGTSTVSASGDSNHTTDNCGTKTLSGTSMAAPTVAGGAVLMRQYFTDGFYPSGVKTAADALNPSSALLKAALVNGAIDLSLTSQATMLNSLSPDGNQGWGRIHLDNVAFFATPARDSRRTRVWDKWNAFGLATGQVDAYPLQVASGQPLKVALAWTDPQGSLLAATTLVNNLDLEVVDPSGNVYRGNVFSNGQSALGGSADLLNNVEVVFLTAPTAGTWTLRVKASSVPGAPAEPGSDRQGYGLVATFGDCLLSLAAPSGVVATDSGAAGVQVGWAAVPGATAYQVYRAAGSCAAAATAFHLVGQTTGTSFTDTLVQGGFGYAYRVRAVTPCSEGALSSCAAATSSANCTLNPVFAGVDSAVNDTVTAACDSLLSWSAGSSACPAAPGITYAVYRSTTPYITPGPATLLTAGQTGISYRDTAVTPNQAVFYRVLAEDATTANEGPANGGNLDGNDAVRAVTPTSSATYAGTWVDDADFTARLETQDPWRITNQSNHTAGGALAYHSAADGSNAPPLTCASVTSPPIPLQADATPELRYFTRYDMELQEDGVVIEISTDGGASWSDLPPLGGYPSSFALTQNPPTNACHYPTTQGAFSGRQATWTEVVHDLSPFAGQTVHLRFRMSTDPAAAMEGFYLDDLRVTSAFAPGSCGTDLRLTDAEVRDVCAGGGAGNDNHLLESGEDGTVIVFAQNVGDQGATAITGTLSSAAPGVVVTRATASFGAADAGEETFSVGPHFGVWISPAVPCGTQLPFTLELTSAQGIFSRIFGLTVGTGSPLCSQLVCGSALPVEDGDVVVAKAAGGDPLQLTFDPSCHASDATVYWGQATGSMTGVAWTGATCGSGPSGSASFSPGTPAPGSLYYFVVVPTNGVKEGSYGKDSSGTERTRASGLGVCNLPQQLGGVCP